MKVGLISDTHGLLRDEAVDALKGVDAILHSGDVGSTDVLDALREIAPVTAIRGNVDTESWADSLSSTELVELGGVAFYLVHSEKWLELEPEAAGIDVVVSGHSHKPSIEKRGPVLWINPGSAGPRRFKLPVTLATASVEDGDIFDVSLVELV